MASIQVTHAGRLKTDSNLVGCFTSLPLELDAGVRLHPQTRLLALCSPGSGLVLPHKPRVLGLSFCELPTVTGVGNAVYCLSLIILPFSSDDCRHPIGRGPGEADGGPQRLRTEEDCCGISCLGWGGGSALCETQTLSRLSSRELLEGTTQHQARVLCDVEG